MVTKEMAMEMDERQKAAADAGFHIPKEDIYIGGTEFLKLTGLGYQFYIDEFGKVIGYMPPSLKRILERIK